MTDLWRGNLGVLLTLFPWVEEVFYERFREQQAAPDYALREHLARLERLLLEQGNTPISDLRTPEAATRGAPKPIAVSTVPGPAPDFDDHENDVELEVKKSVGTGKQAAENFLASAFSLQG